MELRKSDILSKQRTGQLVTTSNTARAVLLSDEAAVAAAVGATKSDRARLAQTQLQLSFTNVVAPISSRAGAVVIKGGNYTCNSLQLSSIYITYSVSEQIPTKVQRLNASGQLTVEASNGDGSACEGHLSTSIPSLASSC